jgi:hypothetical protein
MKTRTAKTTRRREPKRRRNNRTGKKMPRVECLRRQSPYEFSCGLDDSRALLVEESLDERERRG